MAWTMIGTDPKSRAGGILIEIHPELADLPATSMLTDFYARLFDQGMYAGLVFTRNRTYVVIDRVTSPSFKESRFETKSIDTVLLFSHVGVGQPAEDERQFLAQVQEWLEAVALSWYDALPEQAVRIMVPHVVGNLSGAELDLRDGVLGLRHAVA